MICSFKELCLRTFSHFSLDDIYLLKCLLCGGYTDELQDSVMWFSNGGTKSVLHYDAIDNINCLMSGTKELFMVDKVN
jgi:lysine-specific demethylase 8